MGPPSGDLQFEHADFTQPAGVTCANCKGTASPEYYELGTKVFCTTCRGLLEGSLEKLRTAGNLPKAFLYGLGAAVLGSLIFYAVSAITGYQIGLIAVLVGWLVGKAVRKGSGSLGGRRYQIIAVILTYLSVASAHVPDITKVFYAQAAKAEQQSPVAQASPVVHIGYVRFYALVFGLALALPFLALPRGILGLVIIGIALWEAWKFTRAVQVEFRGPFSVAPAAPAPGA